MKLRQLQFFAAIVKTGSFSQAAEVCHATQPTLSNALAQLEKDLGGKLFSRTTRRVELSPFGRHMLPRLAAVLTAQHEAQSAAEAFRHPPRKLLRIGFSPLADMKLISLAVAPFLREHPQVEVFYKECLLGDLSDRLDSGAIDVAILPSAIVPSMFERRPFYSDPLYYLPVHGDNSSLQMPLRVSDLPDVPIILTGGGCGLNETLKTLLESEKVAGKFYPGQAASYAVIRDWSWLGIGAAVLPQAKLDTELKRAKPLLRKSGDPAKLDFCWTFRRDARDQDHIGSFLDALQRQATSLAEGRQQDTVETSKEI